ncbi:copper transporter [Peptostreptococcus faecalis]|uniref:copper transporter n=1 Tax=Peptostreptococcus faecalis TaxID=2045015 RepID=UPI000C7CD758|nr:copper transporter [Peptostreptococcus faecalis]
MRINFKYFIVSIGSIFLALGVGILIGSNIFTNETTEKQNAAIVKDIDNKFKILKEKDEKIVAENERLQEDLNSTIKYIESNKELLTAGKLSGKTVGILSFNEKESTEDIESIVSNSGGKIGFNIVVNETVLDNDSVKKVNDKLHLKLTKKKELLDLITDSIKNSNSDGYLTTFQDLGLIKINAFSNSYESVENVIIFNNSNTKLSKKVDELEIPISESLKENKNMIAVQTTASEAENIKKFSKIASTLNNIDEPIGQVSLVMLVSNSDLKGDFGKIEEGVNIIPLIK